MGGESTTVTVGANKLLNHLDLRTSLLVGKLLALGNLLVDVMASLTKSVVNGLLELKVETRDSESTNKGNEEDGLEGEDAKQLVGEPESNSNAEALAGVAGINNMLNTAISTTNATGDMLGKGVDVLIFNAEEAGRAVAGNQAGFGAVQLAGSILNDGKKTHSPVGQAEEQAQSQGGGEDDPDQHKLGKEQAGLSGIGPGQN